MSYPPYQSGYPVPPNSGGPGNIGFPQQQEFGQPMYPQAGFGFPMPSSNQPNPSLNNQSLPYSLTPTQPSPNIPSQQISSNFSAPYPPQSSANISPFSSSMSSAPYPPAGGGSGPFPPAGGGSAPYPPSGMNSAPYNPSGGSSGPYPPANMNASYPQPGGASSPYAPTGAPSAPYSPSAGAGSAPYPPAGPNISPYGSSNVSSSPYPAQGSPYPASTAPLAHNPYPTSTAPPAHNPYQTSSTPSHSIYPVASLHSASIYGSSHTTPESITPYQERPTVRPIASFDPSSDAAKLRKAMKGLGTDEAAIIQILGRRTSHERQQIKQRYQQSFGRDLVKDLNSELSGQFATVVMALMMPLPIYMAKEMNSAVSGIGTNENTLIEILCTNDNNTIRNIKMEYQKLYGRPLEADLRGDTSGDFRRLMVAMASGSRDESCDSSLAPKLAQSLYNAGAKKRGTDEAEYNRIMSSYSYCLLRLVFQEYVKVSGGKTFDKAIKSELSGSFKDGMLALYECIQSRAMFYARCLRDAMRGMGTNEKTLIRIIVCRSEIDMGNIKDEYRKAFGKRLEDSIASETSGDYKKMLLALIQG